MNYVPTKAHRYFIWLHIKNLILIRYRGAYLGLMWIILEPLMYLLILGFVFATFNKAPIKEYVLYLFSGLIPWQFLERAVLSMTDSITQNAVFIRRIRTPYIYFPLIQLGVAFVDFIIAFSILLLFFLLYRAEWHIPMVVLPLSIMAWMIIVAGLGILLAVLFIFFQDIKPIIQMGLMLLLFTSTIFFKPDVFYGDSVKLKILQYDPVCYWANLFQKPIFYGIWPDLTDWIVCLMSGLILLSAALMLYYKLKDKFYYYV
ncbi:MAG: ABC transporter permease [Desulfobacterales bacterium]|nr:ABC transporter permease [Desulfobacterales bacterium]